MTWRIDTEQVRVHMSATPADGVTVFRNEMAAWHALTEHFRNAENAAVDDHAANAARSARALTIIRRIRARRFAIGWPGVLG